MTLSDVVNGFTQSAFYCQRLRSEIYNGLPKPLPELKAADSFLKS